jgi:hypothetical protein
MPEHGKGGPLAEKLGDGLDCEGPIRLIDREGAAIGRCDRDAEIVRAAIASSGI